MSQHIVISDGLYSYLKDQKYNKKVSSFDRLIKDFLKELNHLKKSVKRPADQVVLDQNVEPL